MTMTMSLANVWMSFMQTPIQNSHYINRAAKLPLQDIVYSLKNGRKNNEQRNKISFRRYLQHFEHICSFTHWNVVFKHKHIHILARTFAFCLNVWMCEVQKRAFQGVSHYLLAHECLHMIPFVAYIYFLSKQAMNSYHIFSLKCSNAWALFSENLWSNPKISKEISSAQSFCTLASYLESRSTQFACIFIVNLYYHKYLNIKV